MLTITITIKAKTYSGVINSIKEVERKLEKEVRTGMDSNEDEDYYFKTEGRENDEE